MTIAQKYEQLRASPSDINELLDLLSYYSLGCPVITEFGTRRCVSAYAFLLAQPAKFITYDIERYPEVEELEALARAEGHNLTFHQQDVLEVDIEPTDVLFIDTFHTAEQCALELERHADKVYGRLIFHDVHTFWEKGEQPYEGVTVLWQEQDTAPGVNHFTTFRGLKYAIEPFMAAHPEWKEIYRTDKNNGLLVLERQ